MREQILSLIEPKVRELAELLTETIVSRVAVMVGQLEFAFEAAASSFESDLARGDTVTDGAARRHDVRTKGQAAGSGAQRRSRVGSRAELDPRARRGRRDRAARAREVTGSRTVSNDGSAPSPRSLQPSVNPALQQGQDLPPSTSSGRKPNSCRKCGAVGFTAATCGKTHNVSTSPATDADTASTPSREKAASSPATSSPFRRATPEPARVQRRDVVRERAEALRDAPPQRSQWLEPDDDELMLSAPRTSYSIDRDIVRGVDEPHKGRRGRPRLADTLTPEQLEAHRARTKERAKERAKQRRASAAAPVSESANP